MKCPWGCGWEGKIEEFEKHLASCPDYLPGMRPERPELIKRLRDAVSKLPSFRIKWTDVDKMSISELRETVKHIEKQLTYGKNEEIAEVIIDARDTLEREIRKVEKKFSLKPAQTYLIVLAMAEEFKPFSSSSNPAVKPTLEELFKGKVLDGYLEASRVRTLNQFMPFTFLFDEGLPTEEKITVKAINKFEAAIKARDEFTKRRGTYHKTSRLVG